MGLLAGVVILMALLSSCALPFTNGSNQAPTTITEEDLISPEIDIQFILVLPSALNQGERVVIEILDEVTGLPYNARQYDLSPLSELNYAVSLPVPQDTVLKYRYVKVGTEMVPEVTAQAEEVRYRLLSVTGAMTVTDSLQSWLNAPTAIETGSIAGQILASETGLPLADILVSAAGSLTLTDANGHFSIDGIVPGVHNVVFYALDGAFETFQQGATVADGRTTPINLALSARPSVEVTFRVTPPNDALGIPIYLAGNITQLGNTFSDLNGGMSIDPKRMLLLSPQEDGTQTLTLSLPAGLDLHYKFTLGDGYWNAEQISGNGGWRSRQLIVPDEDVTIDLSIGSWRVSDAAPVTFEITIPPELELGDEKFIQLKTREWTNPLPLWPLGDGNYLYILFSPLDRALPISYRFCRNADCDQALNAEALNAEMAIQPTEEPQTISLTLSNWANWTPPTEPTDVVAAHVPSKGNDYLAQIELTPEMAPTWQVYAPIGIGTIAEMGANAVQFTPQWFGREDGSLRPVLGHTPLTVEMANLIATSQAQGLAVSLFPQIGPTDDLATYWSDTDRDAAWWDNWFSSYQTFILNYARIAANTGVEQLVIGGKAALPAFSGGFNLDGTLSEVPAEIDQDWSALTDAVRAIYPGKLVWATNAQVSADPLPGFIDQFDAILVNMDAPLATLDLSNTDLIASSFWEVINTQVYPIYEQTEMPILLGLGYPSVTESVLGCLMIDEACSNDGLFLPSETSSSPINLDLQVAIYNTLLPIVADQDWVAGVSIRGYNPVVTVMDGSSSIAGKPARDVIWYWFAGFQSTE
jgi:hypothetical protein